MENYSGMIIWAIVAVIGIVIVAKIVKKIAGVLLLVAILLFSGSIPYSTVNSMVDTATGGYEQITQQAALWHIDENTVSGEKVLYLLNTIPVLLKSQPEDIVDQLPEIQENLNNTENIEQNP